MICSGSPRASAPAGRCRAIWRSLAERCGSCRRSRRRSPRASRRSCANWKQVSNCAPTCANCSKPPWWTIRRISAKEGGLIKPGYRRASSTNCATSPAAARTGSPASRPAEITRTGIASLKVGFNQVFGYYIEITHAHAGKMPADYQRKQTLKNAERYITPELKEYEEKVLSAEDKIQAARIRAVPGPARSGGRPDRPPPADRRSRWPNSMCSRPWPNSPSRAIRPAGYVPTSRC